MGGRYRGEVLGETMGGYKGWVQWERFLSRDAGGVMLADLLV